MEKPLNDAYLPIEQTIGSLTRLFLSTIICPATILLTEISNSVLMTIVFKRRFSQRSNAPSFIRFLIPVSKTRFGCRISKYALKSSCKLLDMSLKDTSILLMCESISLQFSPISVLAYYLSSHRYHSFLQILRSAALHTFNITHLRQNQYLSPYTPTTASILPTVRSASMQLKSAIIHVYHLLRSSSMHAYKNWNPTVRCMNFDIKRPSKNSFNTTSINTCWGHFRENL